MARHKALTAEIPEDKFRVNNRMGVIWMRGENFDEGTWAAKLEAGSKGLAQIWLRNEKYYGNLAADERVYPVTDCWTDDPEIEREYLAAGIEVHKLRPLPEPLVSNKHQSTETQEKLEQDNADLRAQIELLSAKKDDTQKPSTAKAPSTAKK